MRPLRHFTTAFHGVFDVEKGNWLFPIEDRRDPNGKGLAGMLHGIALSRYLQLVDWSSRLIRPGKVALSACVPDILTRLQIVPSVREADRNEEVRRDLLWQCCPTG